MLDFGRIVHECLLERFEAAAAVVEDIRAGAEHEVFSADSFVQCDVDERAKRLDIESQIVYLETHGVHTRFCVERSAGKPLSPRLGTGVSPTAACGGPSACGDPPVARCPLERDPAGAASGRPLRARRR